MLMIDSFTRPFAKTLKNRSLPSWPPFRRAPACLPACLPAPSHLWRPTGPQKFLPSMLALPASLFRKPSPGRIEIEIEIEIGIQIQIHIRIRILVQVQVQVQIQIQSQIHIHVLFKFKTQNSNANANSDSNSNFCGFALAFLFLARLLACGGCQTRGRGVWDGARVGSPDSPPPHSFIHSFIHSRMYACMHASCSDIYAAAPFAQVDLNFAAFCLQDLICNAAMRLAACRTTKPCWKRWRYCARHSERARNEDPSWQKNRFHLSTAT